MIKLMACHAVEKHIRAGRDAHQVSLQDKKTSERIFASTRHVYLKSEKDWLWLKKPNTCDIYVKLS